MCFKKACDIACGFKSTSKRRGRMHNIATDVAGFSRDKMTWPMYLALPFRRALTEPWFKPIARIGSRSNDEYVL